MWSILTNRMRRVSTVTKVAYLIKITFYFSTQANQAHEILCGRWTEVYHLRENTCTGEQPVISWIMVQVKLLEFHDYVISRNWLKIALFVNFAFFRVILWNGEKALAWKINKTFFILFENWVNISSFLTSWNQFKTL